MRLLLSIVAMALTLTAGAARAALSPRDEAAIAALEGALAPSTGPSPATLAQRMATLHVPGVSVAFIEDGKVKWVRAYGVATADGPPATPATLFQAASMSKALAATAALRLVDQGKLALDEDVNRRLKAWKVPDSPLTAERKVTLRELLSHTAGLTVSGFPGYPAGKPVPTTPQILNGEPPANTPPVVSWEPPGAYAYSGGGYTVAQLMIVEAGGAPYPDLLETLVLRPAGMRASTFAQPLSGARLAEAASGHGPRGVAIAGGRNTYPEYAAAGLWTTPSDYGRFLIALQNAFAGRRGAILSPESIRAMTTPVDASAGYGLGLALGRRGGHPYIQHGGSNAGFRCNAFAFLDGTRQGLVVMTNGDGGGVVADDILRAVAAAYGWGEPDPANASSARRAPYVPAP
ncbi:MAG: serine hydrolase [Phenylobacterium sp.]|uniref:serine hydrolase domain-containing protein n=1 Tax=Phenylobacterium sp. TaxID=1871053 RepID=UPI0025DAD33E|nr:serine hydrolase domain-containing protein [Phenylobacterium sp.]MBI1198231.1 serine hydrolase [Phenylobacterium sp.]